MKNSSLGMLLLAAFIATTSTAVVATPVEVPVGTPIGEVEVDDEMPELQFDMQVPIEGRAPTSSPPTFSQLDPMKADQSAESAIIRELPGEAIDERTRGVQLSATDLVLPGNGGLDIVVSRSRLRTFFIDEDSTFNSEQVQQGLIGDWDLDIPRIEMPTHRWFSVGLRSYNYLHTPLVSRVGSHAPTSFFGACPSPFVPPPYSLQDLTSYGGAWTPSRDTPNNWSALASYAEPRLAGLGGGGSEPLVYRNTGNNPWNYPGIYASPGQWTASCTESRHDARLLAMDASGTVYDLTQDPGHDGNRTIRKGYAFEVRSPSGLTYVFDEPTIGNSPNGRSIVYPQEDDSGHIVRSGMSSLLAFNQVRLDPPPPPPAPPPQYRLGTLIDGARYLPRPHATTSMRMFVSEVRDSRGNWIKYEYDNSRFTALANAAPELRDYAYVSRIHSNDGREVRFEWECNPFYRSNFVISTCPRHPNLNYLGRPSMRLKSVTSGGRTWQYAYNDNYTTTSDSYASGSQQFESPSTGDKHVRGRHLESVLLPDGRSWNYSFKMRLQPALDMCLGWREWVNGQPGATVHTLDYSVAYPSGGKVTYRMGPTYRTSRNGQGRWGCWYETGVEKRFVDNAAGSTSTDSFCSVINFENYVQTEFTAYRFEPFRSVKTSFVGQGLDENEWKSGIKEREEIFPAVNAGDISNCPSAWGSLTSPLARSTFVYQRGQPVALAGDQMQWRPYVDDSISAARATKKVSAWISDVGTFETETDHFDLYMRPLDIRESSAAESAVSQKRAWHQEYVTPSYLLWNLGLVTKRCEADATTVAPRVCKQQNGVEQGQSTSFDAATGAVLSTTSYGRTSSFAYHADGELFTQTDPMGRVLTYEDYYRGVPRLVTLPATPADEGVPVRHAATVDDFGAVTSTTSPLSKTTQYGYDAAGRLNLVDFPGTDDATLGISWSADGRTKTTTRGNTQTTITFDGFGRRLTSVVKDLTTGTELAQKWEYDAVGRVVFESLPASSLALATKGTRHQYDALDRLRTSTRTSDGAYSETTFQSPEKKFVRDFDGNVTTFQYRSFGAPSYEQLMKISMPYHAYAADGTPVLKTLATIMDRSDVQGTLAAASQGNQGESMSTRRYAYNANKDLIAEFIPEFGDTVFTLPGQTGTWNVSYCHDENGTVIGKSIGAPCVAGAENVAHFNIDARGQTIGTDFEPGIPGSVTADLSAKFNRGGQLEETSKGGVVSRVYYNDRGTVRRRELRVDSQVFGIGFSYDSSDRLTAITYPSGRTYHYAPDGFGRPTQISDILSHIGYHPNGALATLTMAQGGLETRFGLDDQDRVATIKSGVVNQIAGHAVDLSYQYLTAGNIQTVTDLLRNDDSQSFGYDELGRLVSTQYTQKSGVDGQTKRRGYDGIGNVVFDQSIEYPNVTYTYDPVTNRLASTTGLGNGTRSYDHDTFGNIESDGTRTFRYLADGTLSALLAPAGSAKTFTYDGAHRLVKETKGGKSVYRVYLGEDLLMDFDPAAKTYVEYVYLSGRLVGSRHVKNADVTDSDGDSVVDTSEFLGVVSP